MLASLACRYLEADTRLNSLRGQGHRRWARRWCLVTGLPRHGTRHLDGAGLILSEGVKVKPVPRWWEPYNEQFDRWRHWPGPQMVLAILVCANQLPHGHLISPAQGKADPNHPDSLCRHHGAAAASAPEMAERLLVKPIRAGNSSRSKASRPQRLMALEGAGQLVLEFELTSRYRPKRYYTWKDKVDMAKSLFPRRSTETDH